MIFFPLIILMHYQTTAHLNWFLCAVFFTDQSNGLDILGALFVKHDHAACQFCVTAWRKLAAALTQFCAAHDTRELRYFGTSELIGGHNFTSVSVSSLTRITCLNWNGN